MCGNGYHVLTFIALELSSTRRAIGHLHCLTCGFTGVRLGICLARNATKIMSCMTLINYPHSHPSDGGSSVDKEVVVCHRVADTDLYYEMRSK